MADFDELQTFVIAARLGSFAKAARQLNLSPAMVGRRIQALERQYRLKLIERTTRSQRLTDEGRLFLERAEAVLEAADALSEAGETGVLGGRIRLTAPTTLGARRLPPIIARFTDDHPGVIFEMSLSDRRVDMVTEGFDLAIRVGELPASSLIARRIGIYRFALVASPGFIARHGAPTEPGDLTQYRCIINLNLVPRNRWIFVDPQGERTTVEVSGVIEVDSGEAQRRLAMDGAGIAYLPVNLVEDDIAAGRLVSLLPGRSLLTLPIHTVHPSRHLVPRRVRAFIDAVAEAFSRET
jgi:DNA-binding transcriptional LysR family regulator